VSKQMLVLDVACPQCGAPLTEGTKLRLDAHIKASNQDGVMTLSAIFGDYSVETDLDINEGDIVELSCPQCESSILLPLACKVCGAPMASLNIRSGGYVEFCTRRGCKGHALGGIGDIDQMMAMMNKMFETPYD